MNAYRYLRAQNPYTPPQNVEQIIEQIKITANCTTGANGTTFTVEDKYNFLSLCAAELNHTVPNSLLHEMNTYGKLRLASIVQS